MSKIYNSALEASKFISMSDENKLSIYSKYLMLAEIMNGNRDNIDTLKNNINLFTALISNNVINWVFTQKQTDLYKYYANENPLFNRLFVSKEFCDKWREQLAKSINIKIPTGTTYEYVVELLDKFVVYEVEELTDDDFADDEEDIEDDTVEEEELTDEDFNDEGSGVTSGLVEEEELLQTTPKVETKTENKVQDNGYIEKIHGRYRRQIEGILINAWQDLYGNYVNGQEIINGFIVPGGAILGTGESIKYEGILTLNRKKVEIEPNTMSNAIFEEFIGSARDSGIQIAKSVSTEENEVKPFKYNPMLQRNIASGAINKEAFNGGWEVYKNALKPYIENLTKDLAIVRAETGSDEEIYRALSGYMISLIAVNYKDELGTQLRVCCGDTSKTLQVANRLVQRLRARDKGHRSIAQGKLVVSNAMLSENGMSATISIYTNMTGYQAVPQFMGELLCNLNEGMFKPSLNKMIIGVDMNNNIVTAPFTKWLIPIIAGSRSGKGVLTLNMLLNVIGGGTPLFYLDGKPDMAALLWKLQEKYGISKSMVVDGIEYKGVTPVDGKPFKAPYIENIQKALQSENSEELLEMNKGLMVYLKTMLVILLSLTYYKEHMGSKYGEIFVVFDEMYKVMKVQMETFIMNIDTEIEKLDKSEKERKAELNSIKAWVKELLQAFIGNDIGVFGAGIKAVALTQFAQDGQYSVQNFGIAKTFCTNFLLKRGVKLFGRQEGGTGTYGVGRDKDDEINFNLYDKYFHFGIGSETGNSYNNIKTFKPLLVLNENDCMERTHDTKDGAFTKDMVNRISNYADTEQFREKYFRQSEDLSSAIGFEGALEQVGRLLGVDWQEMLKNSLERAYEISDLALRYYGIIGTDGIDNVYDFICSFNIKHLWSYNQIVRAKDKGISLADGIETPVDTEDIEDESVFGNIIEKEPIIDEEDEIIDFGGDIPDKLFDGKIKELSAEEKLLIQEEEEEKQEEYQEIDPKECEKSGSLGYDEEEYQEEYANEYVEATPEEEFNGYTQQAFESDGRKTRVNPRATKNTSRFTAENSIDVTLEESHPLEKYAKAAFGNIKSSEYQFKKRWESILNSVSRKINADLVTRVMLVQDEMYVNGRYVLTSNILGGFANIRLVDIVDFKMLFKKFKNIKEILIDTTMVEAYQIEQPNLPNGFFAYSEKLIQVGILMPNGTKEVIDRRKLDTEKEDNSNETIDRIKHKAQFEAMCAAKNPRLKDKTPGYQSKVWNASKSFGGRGWESIKNQLTKKNPSFTKAIGLGLITTGVLAIGGATYGVGRVFNLFRR